MTAVMGIQIKSIEPPQKPVKLGHLQRKQLKGGRNPKIIQRTTNEFRTMTLECQQQPEDQREIKIRYYFEMSPPTNTRDKHL